MNIQQFDFSLDLLKVVPWYYDSAPNLISLLKKKQNWYDKNHKEFWENWEKDVFNLRTANDFGLNVWSIILNLPLYVNDDESRKDYPAFGFGPFGRNFNNSNFATSGNLINKLTIEEKRQLLILRLWSLFSDGTMYTINQALNDVFGENMYALDGHDMTITYVVRQPLSPAMMYLIRNSDILPRPSAVLGKVLVKPRAAFGFANYGLNFDQKYSQFGS